MPASSRLTPSGLNLGGKVSQGRRGVSLGYDVMSSSLLRTSRSSFSYIPISFTRSVFQYRAYSGTSRKMEEGRTYDVSTNLADFTSIDSSLPLSHC